MKFSHLLIPTLRDDPADAEVASHILLARGGFIRRLASGSYHWLPLGLRVLKRVEAIVREEMDRTGAQEILMPVVQPAELWQTSGRWDVMGPEMLRLTDRHDRDYCLSPTQEEAVTDLFARTVVSYKQLPWNLYHIQTKFRDEIRPRFGLMRAREFLMKDGYSFHLDDESLNATYRAMYDCYAAILDRIGLEYRAVEADPGNMGEGESHEFHVLAEAGEDRLVISPKSGYAANVEKAEAPIQADPVPAEEQTEQLAKTHTPNAKTIADVAGLLKMDERRCVKTLIVRGEATADDETKLVALVLRGDHQLNEAKAARLDGVARPFMFATDREIEAALGVGTGSIGPVGLPLPVIADGSAAALSSFVCGANEDDYHYVDANWQRDVRNFNVADLRDVAPGDLAADGSELRFLRGIEVGHIFKLGTKYTQALDVAVQDADGHDVAPLMGCYGFGVSRTVAAIVEQCHDEGGIVWPAAVAPFDVHIVALNNVKSTAVQEVAASLHENLTTCGLEVLLDDRDERPGVKFADADLIGIPQRITVGERGLRDGVVELRRRDSDAVEKLAPEGVVERFKRPS